MKWKRGTESSHVEDRRGQKTRRGAAMGIGGIVVALVAVFVGPQAAQLVQKFTGASQKTSTTTAESTPISPEQDPDRELVDFVKWVHEDLRMTWEKQFKVLGKPYEHPVLVLFTEAVNTACGYSTSAIGPFYCPADAKAYIDLSFYKELSRRLGAPGDFAQAYVLAHEVGHHIQSVLGTSKEMRKLQKADPERKNELSVRLELQADCYAGLWGHTTSRRDLLDRDDLKEALDAASAIGDDRLQKRATGKTNPETWTHGSSEQRMRWFKRGMDSGDIGSCDTFSASEI